MAQAFQVSRHDRLHQTVWAKWSHTNEIYEVFADEDCTLWIGNSESIKGCVDVATEHFGDLMVQ